MNFFLAPVFTLGQRDKMQEKEEKLENIMSFMKLVFALIVLFYNPAPTTITGIL